MPPYAVCRRPCGVSRGSPMAMAAGPKVRRLKLPLRSTPPRVPWNTRSSRPFPAKDAVICSVRNRGVGPFELSLCIDLAGKVASVFLACSVPVAGPAPAGARLAMLMPAPAFPGPSDFPTYLRLRVAPTRRRPRTAKCRRPRVTSLVSWRHSPHTRRGRAALWTIKDSPGVICALFLPGVWVAATTVTSSSSRWPMMTRPFPVDPLFGLALPERARQDRSHVRRYA